MLSKALIKCIYNSDIAFKFIVKTKSLRYFHLKCINAIGIKSETC